MKHLDPLAEADRLVREAFEEDRRHETREIVGEWQRASPLDDCLDPPEADFDSYEDTKG